VWEILTLTTSDPEDHMTVSAAVASLTESAQTYHDDGNWASFTARQHALWRTIEANGRQFHDDVLTALRGDR